MFDEVKSQFINGLSEQTWMDYSTREHARLKVGGHSQPSIFVPCMHISPSGMEHLMMLNVFL